MGAKQDLLRKIPKVDEMLQDERLIFLGESTPRTLIVEAVRTAVDRVRNEILEGRSETVPTQDELIKNIKLQIGEEKKKSLRRVINATGVVLHTNLGRANLSRRACESVMEAAGFYSNLEYDIKKGARGSRHDHVEQLIRKITGAEAAMMVNNNAAATMLCLSALAKGTEVIVSRGELVEIGGSFRIPEIMEESGAHLMEVGATNKTKLSDYKKAIHIGGASSGSTPCEKVTGALLKVHTSNYKIMGFTEEVELKELSELGKEFDLPVIYDMGSGLMMDLKRYGVDEPNVTDALKQGADVVLFSGDKLFGGPQGGIIIGKKEYVERMKKHPLARAFRVDKMTLAALEATFFEYQDMNRAAEEIPVLKMITASRETLKERAEKLSAYLTAQLLECHSDSQGKKQADIEFSVEECQDQVGGGSAPTVLLDGFAVTVSGETLKPERLERQLRKAEIPVIVRVTQDKIWLSVRTIQEAEFEYLAKAFAGVKSVEEVTECRM